MRCHEAAGLAVAALLAAGGMARAQSFELGASVRNYNFFRVQDKPGDDAQRRDGEFLSFRLIPKVSFFDKAIQFESHLVLDTTSPSGTMAAAVTGGRASTWLPLDTYPYRKPNAEVAGYFDRLNVRIHTAKVDVTVGRQAITWGVNTFWPALDLFAPFPAMQIDREYKPGVDAVRVTVPLGSRTELQAIGAVLGPSRRRDGSGGALLRVSAGAADFGLMGGKFHGDEVAGGFVSANARGTLLRAELSYTRSGNELDRLRKPTFWRGGFGAERQLTPKVNLVAEVAGNAFGASSALGYPAVMASDRMRRGEVGGLGRWHAGTMVTWKFHALGTLSNMALVNCDDGSALWVPLMTWSVTSGFEVIGGAQIAMGTRPTPAGAPRSEYGAYSNRLLVGFKLYL